MEACTALTYYKRVEFKVPLAGQELRVVSKPGLPHWDNITPVEELLAEVVYPRKTGQVLLMGCGNGALGAALARIHESGSLQMVDTSWIALSMAKMTMMVNGYESVPIHPLNYPLPLESFKVVAIILPKGRKLIRRWLVETWYTLQQGGELFLAGAKEEGIQSVIRDAESLFGNATVLAYRKGCRVARMVKKVEDEELRASSLPNLKITRNSARPPAWTAEAGIARGSWIEFTAIACGETFALRNLPGVFSASQVDAGTALLLQHLSCEWVDGKRVLDFGCGYGLIGMAAARLGAAWVDMLDVDLGAIASAQENMNRNGILNAQARPSDVLDAIGQERYDLILSNPPFHSGKEVAYGMAQAFITGAYRILNPEGQLVLVANRFIRYDRLMKDVFGNVKTLTETGKFHVLESGR